MNANPNTTLNIYVLAKWYSTAWNQAATSENIKSDFKAAGIVFLDKDIFLPSDHPLPAGKSNEQPLSQLACDSPVIAELSVSSVGTSYPAVGQLLPQKT